jgi:glycosyltransferase involved in cell wall biosynthesis
MTPTDGCLRVAHVIAGLEAVHGGPSYSVPRLCRALTAARVEVTLLSVTTAQSQSSARSEVYRDLRFMQDHAGVPVLRKLRRSSRLFHALHHAVVELDLVHSHGLWLMPNVDAARVAARAQRALVVSPRGMLSPAALAFSRTRKRLFWHALQGPAMRRAACLHATSVQEYDEIRAFGLPTPVAVIPNGIDLPEQTQAPARNAGAQRTVLSLGRIHPKKGLDLLLRAWAAVEPRYPNWRLLIAGPDEAGHAEALRGLAKRLGLLRVAVEGPVYDDAKWEVYRAADLFVLPSRNENFGLTVSEALAAGTPVISTRGAPWSRLEDKGCGWWVDRDIEALSAALEIAMALPPSTLQRMGEKGCAWMAHEFSWERAAQDMLAVYRWLVYGGEPPPTLRLD